MSDASIHKPWVHWRGLTSFTVTFSFLLMILSGAILFIAPRGRTANWVGWSFLGFWREQWVAMHITLATLFVLVGIVHLAFNWQVLWGYVLSRTGRRLRLWKEGLAAIAIVLALGAAAVWQLPPAQPLVGASDRIKDHWANALPAGPMPHAELLTLEEVSARSGISVEGLIQALGRAKLGVRGKDQSLLDVALANGTTPARVYDAMLAQFPELSRLPGRGRGGGRDGQGRGGPMRRHRL